MNHKTFLQSLLIAIFSTPSKITLFSKSLTCQIFLYRILSEIILKNPIVKFIPLFMGDTGSKIYNDQQLKHFVKRFQMVRMEIGTGLSFCLQLATKKEMCIKQLTLTNEQDAREYIDMAETKMKLQHDNLIHYVEHFMYRPHFCSQAQKMYVIAQYPFKSLKQQIDEREKLSQPFLQPQLWSILYSCTSALSFLCDNQIQYSGICSKNILIGKDGVIKINDPWLCASDASEVFVSRDGYPSKYLAPEITIRRIPQLTDKELERANMYGLGVVMLECLCLGRTGELEKEGKDRKEVIRRVVGDVERQPNQISKTFIRILKKMLRNTPEKRIGYEELLNFIDNEDDNSNILNKDGQSTGSFAVDLNNTQEMRKTPIVTKKQIRNSNKISKKKKPMVSDGSGVSSFQHKHTVSMPTEAQMDRIFLKQRQPRNLPHTLSPHSPSQPHSPNQNSFTFSHRTRKVSPHRSSSPSKPTLSPTPTKTFSTTHPNKTPEPPSDINVRLFQDRMPTFQPNTIKQVSQKSSGSSHPLDAKLSHASCEVVRRYPDGSVYEGEEVNGRNHGYGRIRYPNGSQYRGNWEEGFMEGEGRLIDSQGKLVYEGTWDRNKLSGYGRLNNTKQQMLKLPFDYWDLGRVAQYWQFYEGEFKDDKKHGKGKLQLTNKQYFQGTFVDDIAQGQGIFQTLDNGLIEGQWKSGQLLG